MSEKKNIAAWQLNKKCPFLLDHYRFFIFVDIIWFYIYNMYKMNISYIWGAYYD